MTKLPSVASSVERRVLVTIDTDFGALVFGANASHRGLIRLPDVPAHRDDARFALATLDEVEAGAMITVQRDKIRLSRP